MSAFEDISSQFQIPLQAEFRRRREEFITKREWRARFPKADLVWSTNHSCYRCFGLEPSAFEKGQAGLDARGAALTTQVRTSGSARGEIPLRDGARLVLEVKDAPGLPSGRPHIGYRIACAALGWLDKKRAGETAADDMLYDPEVRYGDRKTHAINDWLTVKLVRDR